MALKKPAAKRAWLLAISIAVIIVVIIAIVVPLAVILPKRKHHTGNSSTVIVPLYIYPNVTTAWDPLYNALEAHPHLQFLVVVNPSSGPGSSQYPDDNYTPQLEKLNNYTNVQTVGYVRTGYATNNISFVVSEVATYAGWSSKSSSLAMHGIFFDEAPYEYSAAAVEYMHTINEAVKNSTGLQGAKTVIHNPGVIPDGRYNDSTTDITVVFEDNYPAYQAKLPSLETLSSNRSEYCFMVNSVPIMDTTDLTAFVDQLSDRAQYIFITNNDQDFYETFGSQWAKFTDVVPT